MDIYLAVSSSSNDCFHVGLAFFDMISFSFIVIQMLNSLITYVHICFIVYVNWYDNIARKDLLSCHPIYSSSAHIFFIKKYLTALIMFAVFIWKHPDKILAEHIRFFRITEISKKGATVSYCSLWINSRPLFVCKILCTNLCSTCSTFSCKSPLPNLH